MTLQPVSFVVEGDTLVLRLPLHLLQTLLVAPASPPPPSTSSWPLVELQPLPGGFDWNWPEQAHHYIDALEGSAQWMGRRYDVKIGRVHAEGAGQLRWYTLLLINGYPTLHFVEGNDGRYAAIITKDGGRATVRRLDDLPAGYDIFTIADYHQVVRGPYASHGLAVVVDEPTDYAKMIAHAILRWEARTAELARRAG